MRKTPMSVPGIQVNFEWPTPAHLRGIPRDKIMRLKAIGIKTSQNAAAPYFTAL